MNPPRHHFNFPFADELYTLAPMIRRVLFSLLGAVSLLSLSAGQTEYLFLVTGDGIRHQEVFGGVDPQLMQEGAKKASAVAQKTMERVRKAAGLR